MLNRVLPLVVILSLAGYSQACPVKKGTMLNGLLAIPKTLKPECGTIYKDMLDDMDLHSQTPEPGTNIELYGITLQIRRKFTNI